MALLRIKYGDVFEIATNNGIGYIQCVKEATSSECEVVRVLPGTYKNNKEVNLNELIKEKELYFIQFPLKYAVKKKCVLLVENFSVPEQVSVPRYYRTAHKIKEEFICWHIVDSETLHRKPIEKLSDEEINLSPWGSWNDTLLAERMASGWTLDKWV